MSSLSRPLRGNRFFGVTGAGGDVGGAGWGGADGASVGGAGNGAAIDECGAGP
ncbi:hypothetical protein OHB12_29865 [Nocardia sp. NBC_01730]|uniref:hypothetical protein n=1 Tax=Nocardia sp. NBC_01730 TaxID=2975998 RepID=UPI002E15F4F5|nr:hypothetical protein OHB12_29865 [Nocardia sp. NBC_01730]